MKRYGWASGQEGNVLVENREWISAREVVNLASVRSGKKSPSCPVVSMPL